VLTCVLGAHVRLTWLQEEFNSLYLPCLARSVNESTDPNIATMCVGLLIQSSVARNSFCRFIRERPELFVSVHQLLIHFLAATIPPNHVQVRSTTCRRMLSCFLIVNPVSLL
jgi:hypothetical protein